MVGDTSDDRPSSSDIISDETGQLDVRFALWRQFCADNELSVETLPSELSGEAKEEWENLKERDL